jgi:hypothetical protein
MQETDGPLLTFDGLVKLVRDEIGAPATKSRCYKDSMRGLLRPDAYYGNRSLFKPSTALAYGRSLVKPAA